MNRARTLHDDVTVARWPSQENTHLLKTPEPANEMWLRRKISALSARRPEIHVSLKDKGRHPGHRTAEGGSQAAGQNPPSTGRDRKEPHTPEPWRCVAPRTSCSGLKTSSATWKELWLASDTWFVELVQPNTLSQLWWRDRDTIEWPLRTLVNKSEGDQLFQHSWQPSAVSCLCMALADSSEMDICHQHTFKLDPEDTEVSPKRRGSSQTWHVFPWLPGPFDVTDPCFQVFPETQACNN